MVELFAFNITSKNAIDKFEYYLNFLDNMKREQINKYIFQEDKLRSLYGNVIMRSLVSERLGIDKSKVILRYNEYGKPYIENEDGLYFNISHSGDWVICGIGNKELGVDIEKIGKYHKMIAHNYFTKQEIDDLNQQKEEEKVNYFYDLWTLKESYIKCTGRGLSTSLNSFGFKIQGDYISMCPNVEQYNYKRFSDFSDYSIAVCSCGETITNHIQFFEI